MLKPKAVPSQHWDNVSDEELLATELTTENPLAIEGLVHHLPEGDDEPHVEYSYDLRKSGHEEFSCVHGHHRHLKGFVFRKGDSRYLVGWMCGDSIYGTKFDKYKADFEAAGTRRDALKRVVEVREAVAAFITWLDDGTILNAVKDFGRLRGQLQTYMPWIASNLPALAGQDVRSIGGVPLAKHLCAQGVDIRGEFDRLLNETAAVNVALIGKVEFVAQKLPGHRAKIEGLARRAGIILDKLEDVERFFQPAALEYVCRMATENDNRKKRRYKAELLKISLFGNVTSTIEAPIFQMPSRRPIEALRIGIS